MGDRVHLKDGTTIQIVGHRGPDVIDIADLILEMADRGGVVARTKLAAQWKREADNINQSPEAREFAAQTHGKDGRGASLAGAVLVRALQQLEKAGLIQRIGRPPRHAVVVPSLTRLRDLVDAWDAQSGDGAPSKADVNRWRHGDRDSAALAAHLADLRDYRRARAERLLPPDMRAAILRDVGAGITIAQTAVAHGVSVQRIWAYAQTHDPVWGGLIDQALMASRDPTLPHGTERAYRRGECRCPECRTAKRH